jgi:ABC-2 type transport system ATP-binding protein
MNCPIRTQNLSKNFRRVDALASLNLEVPEGSIYALVGPNGAGKTTAIKTLMNILRPAAGKAEVLGVESIRLSPRELARIGYVSENQNLPEWMTVEYFLKYLRPFYPNWESALAEELVQRFDLPLDRKLGRLSRGMQVKAVLASSLAYHPQLLVLDEPFTGLDALVRDQLIEGLLQQAAGATVLISSHDLAEIESFASHLGYLDHGVLRFSEELNSLVQRFREVEVTFGTPPALPVDWPADWMQPETSAAVLRFVDSHFNREQTSMAIQCRFTGIRNVAFSPMSLRAIFVTLAKASAKAA